MVGENCYARAAEENFEYCCSPNNERQREIPKFQNKRRVPLPISLMSDVQGKKLKKIETYTYIESLEYLF